MKRIILLIGIIMFVGWTIALVANYKIYEYTTEQVTLFHPVIDGIILMLAMLFLFFVVYHLYEKRKGIASFVLFLIGISTVVFALMYA